MTRDGRVVVIGGGVTGLAAAYRMVRAGHAEQVVLVERDQRLGGKIVTDRVDGFVIEGGPDSFLSSKPGGVDLCRGLGIEPHLQGTNEDMRGTFVMRDGDLLPMPDGLTGLVPSRLGPMMGSQLFSTPGKLRMALDYVIAARKSGADESLANFVARRLGSEAYDRLIEPLMAGIYAGDGRELSLDATFPQLKRIEIDHGSLLRGIRAGPRQSGGTSRSGFLTLRSGMEEVVEALAVGTQQARMITGVGAVQIAVDGDSYRVELENGEEIQANAVIAAPPAFVTADLVDGLDPDLAEILRGIPYASTATITLAYRLQDVPRPLNGYGYIIPRQEGRVALACTWVSSKFQHRAPDGHALIRVFLGRSGQEDTLERTDEDLVSMARNELQQTLHIAADPELHRIYRWPRAMPQYTLGHLDRLEQIEASLRAHPGLFLAGAAYRGVGIPDCISSGERAAAQALESLRHLAGAPKVATGP